MRKLNRLHVAAALLTIVSVISLLGISLAAGTTGSAATMVTIQNTKLVEVNVWWHDSPGGGIHSALYASWGRTYLHIVAKASNLAAGETIEVELWGRLPNPTKTLREWVYITTFYLSDTYLYFDDTRGVPSRQFSFYADGPGTSEISLSIYLSGS